MGRAYHGNIYDGYGYGSVDGTIVYAGVWCMDCYYYQSLGIAMLRVDIYGESNNEYNMTCFICVDHRHVMIYHQLLSYCVCIMIIK